jgi:hypothetical protein
MKINEITPEQLLDAVAEYLADDNGYWSEDGLISMTNDERKVAGLGVLISKWAGYDGLRILEVFAAALENANFDSEYRQVMAMIENIETDGDIPLNEKLAHIQSWEQEQAYARFLHEQDLAHDVLLGESRPTPYTWEDYMTEDRW